MNKMDLNKRFSYHPATGMKPGLHGAVRSGCLSLAVLLDSMCPTSREKEMAITRLEEVMYWANASIARSNGEENEPIPSTLS